MNCPNCNTENDNDNLFCVSCGGNLAPPINSKVTIEPSPTQYYNPAQFRQQDSPPDSVHTAFVTPAPNFNQPQEYIPSFAYTPEIAQKSNVKYIVSGVLTLLILIGGGIGAFLIFNRQTINKEIFPEHLGLFLMNKEANNLTELSKQDAKNGVQTKDDLLKNELLPATDDKPNIILYSDGKDIPLVDLKLVQLDTIKDDGTLKQIYFQAVPVEGKPEMKRLRVPEGLANGKYAFALFDGFLDEGKHKFWAFQVKNAPKSDNGELAKAMTLSMKPKTAPASETNTTPANTTTTVVKTPPVSKPEPVAPAGAQIAYCGSSNVVVRSSPSLTARKISSLRRGQKVYVLNYSSNYDYWNGMEGNWAYVQTESGGRGWVFSPLLSY
jgi:hypothetical protein